jgi:predicted RND superfamily exporter protein
VSSDYRRANLELRIRLAMVSETAKLVRTIDAELARHPLHASTVTMTGIGALWLKLLDYIISSQVQGFLIAFLVIAAMMIWIFRSLKTGLISMVPNLVPVFLTLGVMGWCGIPLDYSKIMIASVAIGIAVDDTIHLISRYRHQFLVYGDYTVALRVALTDVGRALVITSVVLVVGFLAFTLSVMHSQAMYGVLLATTITSALVADLLLTPALVLTFAPFGPEGGRQDAADLTEAA